MELMPDYLAEKLESCPFGTYEGLGMDAPCAVKYFNPVGKGTWFITEGEKQEDGDWLLYGYGIIDFAEWGYVLLSELQEVKLPLGLSIERDILAQGTVRELYGKLCRDSGESFEQPSLDLDDEEER